MYYSFAGIIIYIAGSWAFGGYIQYSYNIDGTLQRLDFNGDLRSPILAMVCMFVWGFVDSFVQVWSYWMMAQLSDEPEELACYTAFYKLWQNAGAFVSFLLGIMPGFTMYMEYWVNIALSIMLIAPTVCAINSTRGSIHERQDKLEVSSKNAPSENPRGNDSVVQEEVQV